MVHPIMSFYNLLNTSNDNDFKYIKNISKKTNLVIFKKKCIRTDIKFIMYNLHRSNLDS